jgi:quinol monooxygenase YgiN
VFLVHSYVITARDGSEAELAATLEALGAAIKAIAGSESTMILRDRQNPARFTFLEFWADEASRNAAGAQLPKDVMKRLMAAADGPIEMASYDRVAG